MSPEATSSVFPDRLIHPLPKRRLRERLSPDVADAIKYPPALATGAPLFYYPYNLKDDVGAATVERTIAVGRASLAASSTAKPTAAASSASFSAGATGPEPSANQPTRLSSRPHRSNGEHESPSSTRQTRLAGRSARTSHVLHVSPAETHKTIPSTASSVDGYESFENMNNKKKRKIPTVGDSSHGGSYASMDLQSAASGSSARNSNDDSMGGSPLSAVYSGSASFASAASGISGPGRGRYGRSRSGRSPLRPLTDAGSNWAGRYGKLRPPSWPVQSEPNTTFTANSNSGIISSAIANAEKQVPGGQENMGLLAQDPGSASSTPASAQFTFTCASQVPGNLLWPGSDPKFPPSPSYFPQGRTRGGMGPIVPSLDDDRQGGSVGSSAGSGSYRGADGGRVKQHGGKKKRRGKILQELEKQARDRRRAQQVQNATHPQTGDIYVCPFCEYEFITGYKPRLIFAFEMKERKKRLEAEKRQRELRSKDKTKNRNRRGRKASKTGTGPNLRQDGLADGRPYETPPDDPGQGTLDDDYYEDDDGAGEVDDFVAELRPGIGNAHNLRARGRDGEGARPIRAGD